MEVRMLVLSRKPLERIQIGDSIVLTVVRIDGNTVRLGIEAPTDVRVFREELLPESILRRGTPVLAYAGFSENSV
jgi:carbon storage regulator